MRKGAYKNAASELTLKAIRVSQMEKELKVKLNLLSNISNHWRE